MLARPAAVRVPGFRGRPRGGGATPRGTPRAGSFSRDPSLAKRRRLQVGAALQQHSILVRADPSVLSWWSPSFPLSCSASNMLKLARPWSHPGRVPPGLLAFLLVTSHQTCPPVFPYRPCPPRVPQEYDMSELVTPLGAPKFVERAQVKTIDTPRVRTLPAAELKKRQAAVEALAAQLGKKGEPPHAEARRSRRRFFCAPSAAAG
jgi:hypothetical protein